MDMQTVWYFSHTDHLNLSMFSEEVTTSLMKGILTYEVTLIEVGFDIDVNFDKHDEFCNLFNLINLIKN